MQQFDPAKPITIEFEYETLPPVVWKKSYRDVEVTIRWGCGLVFLADVSLLLLPVFVCCYQPPCGLGGGASWVCYHYQGVLGAGVWVDTVSPVYATP